MKHIAIFASGGGTNAENIIKHFQGNPDVMVNMVLCNTPGAGVVDKASRLGVPTRVFNREEFYTKDTILQLLKEQHTDYLILAGFLWLVPEKIIEAFPDRILNIHPALLPSYGGKGMYGMNVHKAVVANKEPETGITIHQVNIRYDEGGIVFQTAVSLSPQDTPETVAAKIHDLEMKYFPGVIEAFIQR